MHMAAAGKGAQPARKWLPMEEIAALKNVSKQAIHKRVQRLKAQKLITTKKGPNGALLINLEQFDAQTERTVDAVRAANGTRSAAAPVSDGTLAKEQARRAKIGADLKQIELDKELGKLLPTVDVEAAMVRCAEALVRVAEQMPMQADDLAAAVAQDGVTGARRFLKEFATDFRAALAAEMQVLTADP